MSSLDTQVGGNHYKNFIIQPVEYSQKNMYSFCCGNIAKYILRYKGKNGLEDLQKVLHYCDIESEHPANGLFLLIARNIARLSGNFIGVDIFVSANIITQREVRTSFKLLQAYNLTGNVKYLGMIKVCVRELVAKEYKKNI